MGEAISCQRIVELMKIERECVRRNCGNNCDRKCDACDLTQEGQELLAAFDGAIELLEDHVPRAMTMNEVVTCGKDAVLWVEEHQGVTWNLFPMEIELKSTHPDTGTHYLFFITYHGIRKFECDEYNQTWRCWTDRPTEAQRKETPWES